MNGSLQYSALTRLLTLNNQVHDLESRMLTESVPVSVIGLAVSGSRIAEIQDEIDQATRASLATCWLSNSDEEEEYEL
jgi:GTP-sensing pleiotropic transcriptional regulator CodY